MNNHLLQLSRDYARIETAIRFLECHFQDQPDLNQMAQAAGVSPSHFQRMFLRWAGISPKKFLQFLTKEYAKQLLKTASLLDVSHEAGLSGPGRLHDVFVTWEAMSPGEYKSRGRGLKIRYGFHPAPFGECLIAVTDRGLCGLQFLDSRHRKKILNGFLKDWGNAVCVCDQRETGDYVARIFVSGASASVRGAIPVLFRGTPFQIKVWEALLRIPPGMVVSYRTLAKWAGSPRAVRAVGSAVGKNPVAYLIPCHRVIRSTGLMGGYRWGLSRKKVILGLEAVKSRVVG